MRECVLQTKSSRAVLVCKIQEAALQLKQFIFLLRTQESQFHFPPIFNIILWLHNSKIKVSISYPS